MSVIANVVASFTLLLDKTHFVDQIQIRLISQLINGFLRVLQKLLKYYNGAIRSTFFVPLFFVLLVIFSLNLNEALLPGK